MVWFELAGEGRAMPQLPLTFWLDLHVCITCIQVGHAAKFARR